MSSVYEEFVIKIYVASRNATQWQIHRKRVLHKVVWITQSIVSTIATKHLYVLPAVGYALKSPDGCGHYILLSNETEW